MKKAIAALLLLTILLLLACRCAHPSQLSSGRIEDPKAEIQETVIQKEPTTPEGTTEPNHNLLSPPATETSDTTGTAGSGGNSEQDQSQNESTDGPASSNPKETEPRNDDYPSPTEPSKEPQPPSTQPISTEPPTKSTEPPHTEPTVPVTQPPTEPEPESTEPPTTEPEGCNHDWECIHHPEEGHWLAGIACDCGWETYGDPDELLDAWYAHVNSYTPAEALLEHGGYGSMDQWIVDKPAYDEWVCRHCGEPKP